MLLELLSLSILYFMCGLSWFCFLRDKDARILLSIPVIIFTITSIILTLVAMDVRI